MKPLRIFYDHFEARRIFYRCIFGWPTNKKSKKIDFFRFFQNWSKISLNIEFCLKNTLNTPRGRFLPIDHHISQYKPLEKNRFFWTKIMIFWDFWDFLNFDDAIDYSAGTGRKCEIRPEMGTLDPQDTSTYLWCYYMNTRTTFENSRKPIFFLMIFHDFPLLLPFCYQMVTKVENHEKKLVFSSFQKLF